MEDPLHEKPLTDRPSRRAEGHRARPSDHMGGFDCCLRRPTYRDPNPSPIRVSGVLSSLESRRRSLRCRALSVRRPFPITTFFCSIARYSLFRTHSFDWSTRSRSESPPIWAISDSSLLRSEVRRTPSSAAARCSSVMARYSASVRPTSASSSPNFVHLRGLE